ncbi:hypothetical protein GOBAR_AA11870 [Gossypium barbadense]|uniref:Uncharacterized protein n=1 Tax=Gossypium barbadense TaxID=3634 RepID=A0A2P5XZP5_GOSBA|nr:hypothetical protein GOBAR_AA11870 [Gossypium barbadense]
MLTNHPLQAFKYRDGIQKSTSINQGDRTQIGQLAKSIFERPQGSLPSNTESNPREQLNAIAIQDEEGLVAKPRPETVVSKGKNEVGQNDPKSKSRTPDKPKSSQDKLNTSPNQLGVGEKVLLDVADPRIATPKPSEEIPLTVLSTFPYGIVEAHGCALGCVKTGQDFFPTRDAINLPRLCDMAVGEMTKTTRAQDTPMPRNRG